MRTEHPLFQAYATAEEKHIPLGVLVELTHACNADCEHCYLDLVPDAKIGALSTEEWKRVFREVKAEGGLFLTLSGGELLVRKDWYELARYARELGFVLRLYSNALLIDEATADRIRDLKPQGVEVSLLGGTAFTHDTVMRRRGAFEKAVAGVRRLRERGVAVLLKCVVMRRNAAELDALRELASALGCDVHFDVEVTPKNNGSREPTGLSPDDPTLQEALRDIWAHIEEKNGSLSMLPRQERLTSSPCAAGRRTCHIGPTGDVHPCVQWVKPVGNLRETTFHEVWARNAELNRIRQTRIENFPVCVRCELLDLCSPCMALSLLERGQVDGPSPTKCRTAELRARSVGKTGRSAWLLEQEHQGKTTEAASSVFVALRRKDGRVLGANAESFSS